MISHLLHSKRGTWLWKVTWGVRNRLFFFFWQELGWHQEKLYTCEKLLGNRFVFALPSGFMKEREVQTEIPLSRTCLMSGKHRGCSQHIWHLNPCRSWDAIQLSCLLHWALWVILKRLVHSQHTSHVFDMKASRGRRSFHMIPSPAVLKVSS